MAIAPPNFVSRDPATVETEIVDRTAQELQRDRIYDGEPIRLFLAVMAYRETLIRAAIQFTGEQNLVSYAQNQYLDLIGEAFDAPRLTAAAAVTTLRFTKDSDATNISALVPQGTRVQSSDGSLEFATDTDLVIGIGSSNGTVQATCSVVGIIGNGYQVGEVSAIVDPSPYVSSATNISITNGGADVELDENYRIRLKLAPSKFSVAGPTAAYEFFARSADSDVFDVAVVGPPLTPFRVSVYVYVLASGPALPTAELLNTVNTALQDNAVRPLCDEVTVLSPSQVSYEINAQVTLDLNADSSSVATAIQSTAEAYAQDRRDGLGRDIVLNQIIGELTAIDGVYDVSLLQPIANIIVDSSQWANAINVSATLIGSSPPDVSVDAFAVTATATGTPNNWTITITISPNVSGATYVVQESVNGGVYQPVTLDGSNQLTGKANGIYVYRVQAIFSGGNTQTETSNTENAFINAVAQFNNRFHAALWGVI
ncbi:MAG: baseplate J/gp47 family protein [Cyanobacteria bacterium P01_E01_bin.6]